MSANYKKDDPSFMNYLADNYNIVKKKLQILCNGYNEILFDEDVFHDTIIKVNNILLKPLNNDSYEKYLCKSFRTNLVRDKLYFRNSMTEHTFDFEGIEPYTFSYVESTIDFENVIKILDKKFGINLTKFYIDWLSGYSVKEAMVKDCVDSGYYYIKLMTNYIRSYHTNGKILY